MINLETIDDEIDRIEVQCDTSFRACERLAWLYVVRDHLAQKRMAEGVTEDMRGSEFLRACSGLSYPSLMRVLDEHMTALAVVQPKEYESLMQRIRNLR